MDDINIRVQVIGLNPDVDRGTGETYTQVNLGIESPFQLPPSNIPFPNIPSWKFIMNVFIPGSKWKNQYKIWQKYDLVIKENGELNLKPV